MLSVVTFKNLPLPSGHKNNILCWFLKHYKYGPHTKNYNPPENDFILRVEVQFQYFSLWIIYLSLDIYSMG